MSEAAQTWELVLRGLAIGTLWATAAAGFWRGALARSVRLAGVLFALSVIAYTLQSSAPIRDVLGPFAPVVHFMALGGGGLFWLFIVTLFEDRSVTPLALSPAALLTALGLVGWLWGRSDESAVWVVHNLIEVGLAGHAMLVVARGWRGDLVEARRRLRGPFLAMVTLFVVILAGFEIGEAFGVRASWYSLAGALALALFCSAGAVVFLRADPDLLGAAPARKPATDGLGAAERLILERLDNVMDADEAWRREGLTIGALAAEIGLPEHRLRRLINDHLGHRNFAAFVNARRVEAAMRLLSDPARARQPVSAIAFDLGFGSLGPFNRAFKEATGATPTEWRRHALEKASPKPEKPG
jgi:AraC-like DNA-binding protein